ncbi:HalOD1 output domain-containing protein [Halobacteriaceae archaeon SHR40]|uniref:HalOD1 output domain-containing protein n=1 Tax=Halovenus amylolytica TaxID=2500550 RepID=UPI000FE4044B
MPATLATTELDLRTSDIESKAYQARFDQDVTTPSMAVVAGLAELTGTEPDELTPLQLSVDTGALDRLVGGTRTGEQSVTFRVETYTVTVRSDGFLSITQSPQDPRPRPEGQER